MTAYTYPERIVCLTEETTETLYLLGEQDRIVGISGFTVRPPQARLEKPKTSAFTSARIDAILDLKPDLVLGFSNLQGDIARDLIKAGVEVYVFNHRSVSGILRMIATLGALVGEPAKGEALAKELAARVEAVRAASARLEKRPRVYFEEWDEPMISGIRWVSELIAIAGGEDCFAELGAESLAGNRIIHDAQEVVRRRPDIIIGSWCGKKFQPAQVKARTGWETIPAVSNDQVFEIKSPLILQPGPAALTDGLDAISAIVSSWVAVQVAGGQALS
jgi:iron complex transport system substrate-binding protein